jgi:hypothetical protein
MKQTKWAGMAFFAFALQAAADNLFVWDRPGIPTYMSSGTIANSTTCSFKKSMATSVHSGRIVYSLSDEDERDTVSFTDLNSAAPRLESNAGQVTVQKLSDDSDKVVLLNAGRDNNPADGVEIYTIFRKKRLVIYTQQKDSFLLSEPFGDIAMGYCR